MTPFMIVINGKIEGEAATEAQARQMAEEGALRGSVCKIARVVAECVPDPVPSWTEVSSA
jgi:hypothetical protein